MKLFGRKRNGSNAPLIIIQQLRALSQQMAEFRNEVMQQFMQVHYEHRLIYEAVCQGFNLIYFSVKAETNDLKYSVISRLEDIQGHLGHLETQLGDGFRQLATQPLLRTISAVETEFCHYEKDKTTTISKKRFKQLMDELVFWLISRGNFNSQCKSPSLTGAIALPQVGVSFQQNHYNRVLHLLAGETPQLGQALGFLLPYAQYYLLKNQELTESSTSFKDIINIEIWCFVVDAYIKLRQLGAHSNISYDVDESELKTILKDADSLLHMLAAIQKNKFSIFSSLTEQYNGTLNLLKSQLKEEIARILSEELVRLGNTATRLPLDNATADVRGARLPLRGATADGVTIPASLMLAQRFGLGKFIFKGNRSKRDQGSIRRHGNHDLGVSGVFPSANFIVDGYFEFNDGRQVHIASGEKFVYGGQDDSNPGKKDLIHIANANYARVDGILTSWRNKSDSDFFKERWTGGFGLVFKAVPAKIVPTEIQRNLEIHLLKENLNVVVTRDAVKDCYLKLNFFHALIQAYRKIIGDSKKDYLIQLATIKNGDEINTSLIAHLLTQPNSITTIDNLCASLMPAINLEAVPINDKKVDKFARSPLAYPLVEQISRLSSLFTTEEQPFQEDYNSEDEIDEELNQKFSEVTLFRKQRTCSKTEDNERELLPISVRGTVMQTISSPDDAELTTSPSVKDDKDSHHALPLPSLERLLELVEGSKDNIRQPAATLKRNDAQEETSTPPPTALEPQEQPKENGLATDPETAVIYYPEIVFNLNTLTSSRAAKYLGAYYARYPEEKPIPVFSQYFGVAPRRKFLKDLKLTKGGHLTAESITMLKELNLIKSLKDDMHNHPALRSASSTNILAGAQQAMMYRFRNQQLATLEGKLAQEKVTTRPATVFGPQEQPKKNEMEGDPEVAVIYYPEIVFDSKTLEPPRGREYLTAYYTRYPEKQPKHAFAQFTASAQLSFMRDLELTKGGHLTAASVAILKELDLLKINGNKAKLK